MQQNQAERQLLKKNYHAKKKKEIMFISKSRLTLLVHPVTTHIMLVRDAVSHQIYVLR